jgi:hypothetical protein
MRRLSVVPSASVKVIERLGLSPIAFHTASGRSEYTAPLSTRKLTSAIFPVGPETVATT